jgi:hypothetical protein
MSDKSIKGDCSVSLIRENEDGSADYQFNFPPEALAALTRLGILTAIQAGIAEAECLNPAEKKMPTRFTKEIKKVAEEAGFVLWDDEHWKPKGAVVDWAILYDKELVKFYHLARRSND